MNLTSPAQVDALLRRQGMRPRKRWGQNFLIDRNTLWNVLRAAEVGPEDAVLEIGPGLGTLTRSAANVECKTCHQDHHKPTESCMACHPTPRQGVHTRNVHVGCGGSGCQRRTKQ